jgi:death-on-curing protein
MNEIKDKYGNIIYTLSVDEILDLHEVLCNNYQLLPEMEPIRPAGVKNMDMLESAVSRQMVGSMDYYKYGDLHSNCATVIYGIVKNHAFHNGNKRMGFLVMLKHLYKNSYVITPGIKHNEIYELLTSLASNSLNLHARTYYQNFFKIVVRGTEWSDETDITYLSYWLRQNTENKNVKIKLKTISLNDLQAILQKKELTVKFDGKYLEVVRPIFFFKKIFGGRAYKKHYSIKKSKNIPLNVIEDIRRDFNLSFRDGVDNNSFYNDDHLLNEEIISYKTIIYRLAKT